MEQNRWVSLLGALLLIVAGVLFLLNNLGFVPDLTPIVWALLLVGGGAAFLLGYAFDRAHWWPLIPGSTLVGVGLAILLGSAGLGAMSGVAIFACPAVAFAAIYLLQPRENWWALIPGGALVMMSILILVTVVGHEALGGVIFFAGLGLAFVAAYFAEINGQRHQWWTLIPAGALLSLAAVVLLSTFAEGSVAGAALFLGMGVTFGVLYLLRGPDRPLQWAWIPAVALLGFGALTMFLAGESIYARLFWPLALILGGLVVLLRNQRWLGR